MGLVYITAGIIAGGKLLLATIASVYYVGPFRDAKEVVKQMSEFVVIAFPDKAAAQKASGVLKELRAAGLAIYGSVILAKDSNGTVSVFDRVKVGSGAAVVAALIGALAGLPAGPVGAVLGATAGALTGISADLTNIGSAERLLEKLSHELDVGKSVLAVDLAPDAIASCMDRMQKLGGIVLHPK